MHVITVALFATQNANDEKIRKAYLAKARALLVPYKLRIDVFTSDDGDEQPRVLPYSKSIHDDKDCGTLRAMCHRALPVGRGIPVIFGMFFQASDFGCTVFPSDPQNDGVKWLPYVLINTRLRSKSDAVLLHELIHAAYGEFPPAPAGGVHDAGLNSVFHDCDLDSSVQGGLTQLQMPSKHVDPLQRAYFTNYIGQ